MRLGEGGFVPNGVVPIGNGWFKSGRSNNVGACVATRHRADGGVEVAHSKRVDGYRVTFTGAEWDAFLAGVRDGEFDRP